eukprot:GHRR01006859.1.p1 GENE.GHRR01006859.1~~GHRR01006859.1.p1  ORF type:complete len:109 (+),score=29.05 GHRR01006859.1:1963-2289(+)
MIAPQTHGAKRLYDGFVKPFLATHAGKIDPVFQGTQAVINSNLTNQIAKLVETQGPAAAATITSTIFSNDNMAKLSQLAQADPQLVQRALRMVSVQMLAIVTGSVASV